MNDLWHFHNAYVMTSELCSAYRSCNYVCIYSMLYSWGSYSIGYSYIGHYYTWWSCKTSKPVLFNIIHSHYCDKKQLTRVTSAMIYRLKCKPSVTQNFYGCQLRSKKSLNFLKLLAYIRRWSTLVHLVPLYILKVSWFYFYWLVDSVKPKNWENLTTHLRNQPCTKITLGTNFNFMHMVTFKVP